MTDLMGYSDSSPFDSLAAAYDAWFEKEGKLGFCTEKVTTTLFQKPYAVGQMEAPQEGFHPEAEFIVIMATKKDSGKSDVTQR